jgi:hypothetical protein
MELPNNDGDGKEDVGEDVDVEVYKSEDLILTFSEFLEKFNELVNEEKEELRLILFLKCIFLLVN